MCVEFVSHTDYNGEQLRKLGERGVIGSELHLKSINVLMVRRRTGVGIDGVKKTVTGVLQWSAQATMRA